MIPPVAIDPHLQRYIISLADDALILGQRLSELCSNGPFLEEDLAISNVALDYIGRASMFYQYAVELSDGTKTEDSLVFFRDVRQFTNLLINELPNGDFAFMILKQYYLDQFNVLYLQRLCQSSDSTLAAIAAKTVKESRYHLKRSKPWVQQLSAGTEESIERIKQAVEELQSFIGELFVMSNWEQQLSNQGIAVERQELKPLWQHEVTLFFKHCGIEHSICELKIKGGRDGIHTEHLGHLLSEMQSLQRAYPGLEW